MFLTGRITLMKGKGKHCTKKTYGGSGCIDPRFLDLSTNWRWVVSFTPRPLYLRYPLARRLGGPLSRSGRRGEEKILDPTGTRNSDPLVVHPVASHYTYWAIPAPIKLMKRTAIRKVYFFAQNKPWDCSYRSRIRDERNVDSGGMRIGKGNSSTCRKLVALLHCPP
jgi:hypothetical protein